MKWKSHADQLAGQVTHPISRWRPAVGAVPRHLFVPCWWERSRSAGCSDSPRSATPTASRSAPAATRWSTWPAPGTCIRALGLAAPGIEHDYAEEPDGRRTAWMVHPDGSWARATAHGDDPPAVHQSGPRRLWDLLDDLRASWLRHGSLPVHGADATLTPDGTIHLRHARWRATLPAGPEAGHQPGLR